MRQQAEVTVDVATGGNYSITSLGEAWNGDDALDSSVSTLSVSAGALYLEAHRIMRWNSPNGNIWTYQPSSCYSYMPGANNTGSTWSGMNSFSNPPTQSGDAGSIVKHDAGALDHQSTGLAAQSVAAVILQDHAGKYTVYPFFRQEWQGFRNARAWIAGTPKSCSTWAAVLTAIPTNFSGSTSISWDPTPKSEPSPNWRVNVHGFAIEGAMLISDAEGIAAVNHLRTGELDGYTAWLDSGELGSTTPTGTAPATLTPDPASPESTSTAGSDGSSSGWLAKYWAIARGWLEPLYGLFYPLEYIGAWAE